MKKVEPPEGKHTLVLYFDTPEGVQNFSSWYLDGGGEQESHYYVHSSRMGWMYLMPPEDACPRCEYCRDEESNNNYFFEHRSVRRITKKCHNCGHKYPLKNPYSKDGT